ncbi:MAG: HlyD family efflux transporter periplasmic adaptor subunit [Hymenobacteraceae bacterium]|nr:HlyD family efflux transporter periplasmic adaptor subunit [Hymenobacteraceae bacterium]
MDRVLSAQTQRRQARRPWLIGALAVLLLVAGLVAFRSALRPSIDARQMLTARVEVGAVEATLTAGGTVVPGREFAITAPIASTIRRLVRQVGDKVQAGEPLLELDTEQAASDLGKLRDEQARQQNKTAQLNLTLEQALNDLRAQQAAQEARLGSLQAALRDEQYLLKIGGTTAENVRQAELNQRVAELELRRLRDQVRTQHRAAAADQREVGFQLASQARDIREHERQLRQAAISADQPGVLTWINDQLGATVAQGTELARVADLSAFRVRATISDSYAEALHPADPIIVRLGSSGPDLRGRISTVNPAVDKGSVTFYATLDDPRHAALRPNLRVDVFVVTSRQARTLRVKNGPFYQGGREQAVYVVRPGGRAERRTVQFGESNFDWVQITGGLRPGDELIVTETKDFGDAPVLTINE